jgi:hypothetical protein
MSRDKSGLWRCRNTADNNPVLADDCSTITSRMALRCVICGNTDMGLVYGFLAQSKSCCGNEMEGLEVPDGVVVIWKEESA